ncbi:CGNR zinc finger domain-containing protein [Isoptericola halotolerans]|uniref:RNA-binding Zn ribbon-like protein n=1 Tax=Isoptericola halotolerans TaxID=300560 RepID=A0ABX2A3M1_9MICO|nr:CGNR zinc finger domain-containing protein [Isoptericola halotolerans]NOV97462.1 putative RNA-binding Zn ribbon-like protein [Isoptericola halotolerans]
MIDLLNTTSVVDGRRTDELTDDAGQAWARAHGGAGLTEEVATLRRVRDAVQEVIHGAADPQDVAADVEKVAVHPVWREGSLGWEVQAPAEQVLASRALLAWAVVHERSPGRLRPCANPECCRFLLDRSNANTARWCSMALCGNRVKARRHYRRTRADEQ